MNTSKVNQDPFKNQQVFYVKCIGSRKIQGLLNFAGVKESFQWNLTSKMETYVFCRCKGLQGFHRYQMFRGTLLSTSQQKFIKQYDTVYINIFYVLCKWH